MDRGPLSLLYGDLDLTTIREDHNLLVGFALAGPLRLKLPNGSDLTVGDQWFIWLPVGMFGQALEFSLGRIKHSDGSYPRADLLGGRTVDDLADQGYQLPDDDTPDENPF